MKGWTTCGCAQGTFTFWLASGVFGSRDCSLHCLNPHSTRSWRTTTKFKVFIKEATVKWEKVQGVNQQVVWKFVCTMPCTHAFVDDMICASFDAAHFNHFISPMPPEYSTFDDMIFAPISWVFISLLLRLLFSWSFPLCLSFTRGSPPNNVSSCTIPFCRSWDDRW